MRGEAEGFDTFWRREGDDEVDFALRKGGRIKAIEVKSGRIKGANGLCELCRRFPEEEPMVVGDVNAPVEAFLQDAAALF